MSAGETGALTSLAILGRMMARRLVNRMAFRFSKKKDGKRDGTGTTKKTGFGVLAVVIWCLLLFQSFNIGSSVLKNLAGTTERMNADPSLFHVPEHEWDMIRFYEKGIREQSGYPDIQKRYRQSIRDRLTLFADRQMLPEEESARLAKRMDEAFDTSGSAAFRADRSRPAFIVTAVDAPGPEAEPVFLRNIAAVFALSLAALVGTGLGLGNKDLGAVDWSFEWLYTFPVSSRTLVLTRMLTSGFINPLVWGFLFPFCILFYLMQGLGMMTLPAALLTTLYLGGAAGMILVLSEVAGRKCLGLVRLKSVQAFCTLAGALAMFTFLALMRDGTVSQALARFADRWSPLSPANPFALPVLLAKHDVAASQAWLFAAGMAALLLLSGFLCLALCGYLTRDGLTPSVAAVQGDRREHAPAGVERRFKGVVMNELLLLARDKSFAMQVLAMPLLGLGFYFYTQPGILRAISGNSRHGASIAFGVGAYILTSSAMSMLVREKPTLWMLLTFPRALSRIFIEKTLVWAGFAALYTTAAIVGLACYNHRVPSATMAVDAFFAIVGVILYAFIAGGIGILSVRLDDTPGTQVKPNVAMIYLYMGLSAMFGYTLYAGEIWSKITMTVLAALLACALWQKAHDRLHYLLDPDAMPPRRIDLADGLIAAQLFFFIQAIVFAIMTVSTKNVPNPTGSILVAFVVAGAAVVTIFTYCFWRQKVTEPVASLGLLPPVTERRPVALVKKLGIGAGFGVAAAAFAGVYLRILDMVPAWREWKTMAELHSGIGRAEHAAAIFCLAVIAAPLFEEFIFRGLIFKGLSRALNPAAALFGSAAVFAIVHPGISVIPVFGLGLAAAHVYRRTGWIAAPIVAHAVYNALVLFVIPH